MGETIILMVPLFLLFEPVQQKGTGGSTQLHKRGSREVGKRHESMKALLVVLAIVLLGAR